MNTPIQILPEAEARALGVTFDFRPNGVSYKSIGGLKRSVRAQEKDGGFNPRHIAYYYEDTNWKGDPAFFLVFGLLPA